MREETVDGLLILGAIFLILRFVVRTATAPSRSAASLRRIEDKLNSRR